MQDGFYWSSAEYSDTQAWSLSAYVGTYCISYKTSLFHVREVRSFSYRTDSNQYYLWNTGDTTSTVTVSPTQTTTYIVTVSATDKCDGVANYTIVVNRPDTVEIEQTACDSYDWNGVTYTESSDYTQSFTNQYGCDSIVTLHLTVYYGTHNVTDTTVCESFTWEDGTGETYTESGTYTYGYINADGCSSTDTLYLNVIPVPELSHTPDTVIIAGTAADLWASGADVLTWTNGNGEQLASGTTLTVSPENTTTYFVHSFNEATNLVYNGDFELGNIGFETDYIYGNTGSHDHYYVGHDISNMWPWDSPGFPVPDHTSGSGMFLMIDGSIHPNTTVWSQTIPVEPNTNYLFSAWFLTDNIAYFKYEINGVQTGIDYSSPEERWTWVRYSQIWNSGSETEAVVKIINRFSQAGGYDYCIDDITFTPLTECSVTDSIQVYVTGYPDNVDSADCTFLPEGTEWGMAPPIVSEVVASMCSAVPMVGDVDDDGIQEIVMHTDSKVLIFNDNATLETQFNVCQSRQEGQIGLAKVQYQPNVFQTIIVVYSTVNKYLYAYDANGNQLWQSSQPFGSYYGENYQLPAISFADFNHDGWTEIFLGSEIFDAATGVFLGKTNGNRGYARRTWENSYSTYQSSTADLCGDANLELAVGNTVYSVNLQSRTDASLNQISPVRTVAPGNMVMADATSIPFTDGNTFLVDINLDGKLDVLVMTVDYNNRVVYVYIWDVESQTILCSKKIPNSRKFGMPQIGDLDNDGFPEICFITGTYIDHTHGNNETIYALKYNDHIPTGELDVFWTTSHLDFSGATSLTLFDFNQDGLSELVYRDEAHLRIINGSLRHHQTNEILTQPYDIATYACGSGTALEYPIVCDVDQDGAAEILIASSCSGNHNGHLYIFKSAGVPWAPARKVWNQYMYNVTNVNEDLTIPQYLFNNATAFTDPDNVVRRPYNNFLQQATTIDQYGRPFYAVPDVAVETPASLQTTADSVVLTFSYCNIGDNTLNAPYPVTVFANAYGGDTLCTIVVNDNLPVDSCTTGEIRLPISTLCGIAGLDRLVVAVNGNSVGIAQNGNLQPECDTTNNTAAVDINLQPDSVTIEEIDCESHDWNDVTYTESGDYTQTFTNAVGCDSIVTLHLTINHGTHNVTDTTVCESYTWEDGTGETYTESGTYTHDYTNSDGCASTDTLHLTVNHALHQSETVVAYDSYLWNGVTYTQSGDHTFTHTDGNGCTQVDTLHLTLYFSSEGEISAVACESYTWNDSLYSVSGDYVQSFLNIHGADSVVTLHLTVNYGTHNVTNTTVCESYTWANGTGDTYTESGTYLYDYTNSDGCASTDTLHLTVNYGTYNVTDVTTCDIYTWTDGTGDTYTESGDYTQMYTTVMGCDSVEVLHLIVIPTPELSHTLDTLIIAGTSAALWGDGADYLYWTDGDNNILSSGNTLTVSPESCTTTYYLTGESYNAAMSSNLVVNGDFEFGNEGFSSAYSYVQSSSILYEGYYTIGMDAHNYHPGFYSWPDHTTGAGNYMIINGAVTPNTNVWTQTVNVVPNTDYAFSSWVCNIDATPTPSEEAQLQFSVNGVQLGAVFTAPSTCGVWNHYYEVWNSGNNTSAVLTILNQNTIAGGNDFGIDDIVFAPLSMCSTTDSVTVTLIYQTSDERTICDSELPYEWNGVTFTEASTQAATLTASNGCDSVVTMTLTVNPTVAELVEASACESYDWNDVTYTESGDYTQTFTNAVGCDSIVTLHLTVNYGTHNVTDTTVCESFTWTEGTGESYTVSGTYTFDYTNSDGCASTDTLHLTVNYGTHNVTDTTVCESFTWTEGTGESYTESGTYTFDYTNGDGCASTDTLHLTVYYGTHNVTDTTVCENFTWSDGTGETYTESGTYLYDYTNSDGCASTDTLHLTVNHSTYNVTEVTACESYTWYGDTLTQSGEYVHMLTNAAGCDSVVQLTLQISPYPTAVISGFTTLCADSVVTLTADSAFSYLWCTGDTTRSISATEAGVYSLTVTNEYGCSAEASHPLGSVNTPTLSVTAPDMCAGGSYTLSVGYQPENNIHLEHGETTLSMSDTIFLPDGIYCDPLGCSYQSTLTFTAYAPGDTIQSVEDIYYVKLNIEHSWIGDLYINITCPNGQKADLLKYGGIGTSDCNNQIVQSSRGWAAGNNMSYGNFLGEALDFNGSTCDAAEPGNEPGVGWNYCWSENTSQGYTYAPGVGSLIYRIENAHNGIVDSSNVTAGTNFYRPDDSFSNLIGCPLNGDWYIEVQDGWRIDNGYIFGWELALSTDALPYVEYEFDYSTADGPWLTTLSDTLFQITPPAGLERDTVIAYTFTLHDTIGCGYDTTLYINVYAVRHTELDTAACESFTWNDSVYTVSGQYVQTFTSAVGCDSVVTLHLTVHYGTHNVTTLTVCESYTWTDGTGETYTVSGTYLHDYTNSDGCASTDTLHLTVNYSTHNVTDTTVCEIFIWTDGTSETYTESGTYTFDYTNGDGCASTDTLHLTVNHPVHTAVTVVECETYTWADGNGQTYTVSGTYTYAHNDANGCTQVDTLHLTIHYGTHNVTDVIVCESFTWTDGTGETYTESGTYTFDYTNDDGCASTDTLHLTVNYGTHDVTDTTVCESFTWTDGTDETYTESGTYTFDYTNGDGCASTDTLHLTVNNPVHTAVTVVECDSYTWADGDGQTYTVSGTYTYAHDDANGCTQVDTLHLTIHYSATIEADTTVCQSTLPLDWNGVTFTGGGSQTLSLTTSHGCDSTVTLTLNSIDDDVQIVMLTEDPCEDFSAELLAQTEMTGFQWSTGDITPQITTLRPGTYYVTASEGNCAATASFFVPECEFVIYLPNAITATEDNGVNDYFFVPQHSQRQIKDFEIHIYNRWGQLVFHSEDKNFKWDGSSNGKIFANTTYTYVILCTNYLGKQFLFKGSITVL